MEGLRGMILRITRSFFHQRSPTVSLPPPPFPLQAQSFMTYASIHKTFLIDVSQASWISRRPAAARNCKSTLRMMELPGWSFASVLHVNNWRLNIGAVLLSVASRALAIDQLAEIALHNLTTADSEPPFNTSTVNSTNFPAAESVIPERNISETLHHLVPVFSNRFSRSHLVESQDFSYSRSSSISGNHQDGLSHLGVPLICAAVSLLIFGIILFIKKVALSETTQPFSFDVYDDENVVLNGDDVMYLLPSAEYLDELQDVELEDEACQCVTVTETLEFEEPSSHSSHSRWNRYI